MKVLYVAGECKPFSKAGGVGDVAGELPVELKKQGVNIEIATPMYDFISPSVGNRMPPLCYVNTGSSIETMEWFQGDLAGVPVHFARNRNFGSAVYVSSPIPFLDDALRFSLFSEACLELIARTQPDIVHINDWILAYLFGRMEMVGMRQAKVLTIHNIGYQGNIGETVIPRKSIMADLLSHYGDRFRDPRAEWRSVNAMRLAMELADTVNAVSPTYAAEMTEAEDESRYFEGGKGLHTIAQRVKEAGRLKGILNGFQYKSPPTNEEFEAVLQRKAAAKEALGTAFADRNAFLLGFVGRAVEQKFKLLTERLNGKPVLEHILEIPGVNVAILATGLPEYHAFLETYRPRDNYSCTLRFDLALAAQISLGCDVFLMPSLFEPCGIAQMESMSNATPPLVRKTGGLADTVLPHDSPAGSGFVFDGHSKEMVLSELVNSVREAAQLHSGAPEKFRAIQWHAFQQRFAWERSAVQYIDEIYKPAVKHAQSLSIAAGIDRS